MKLNRPNFSTTSRVQRSTPCARGFTLMELTVSIAILVIIILSVGVTFSGASRSVSVSNATMEMMSSVRSIQTQIEQDVSNIDRTGYIAIRVCLNNPSTVSTPSGKTFADLSYHFDQISFVSRGSYNNRTGADTTNSPFTDSSTASAAHIWIGQGVLEAANRPDNSYFIPDQTARTPPGQTPTGLVTPGTPTSIKESEFTLMRHQGLLIPSPAVGPNQIKPAGNVVMAHSGLENVVANTITSLNLEPNLKAHISSSRYSVVAQSPSQVYQSILQDYTNGLAQVPEVDLFTYRFRALASIYDTEQGSFVNGYFRTTPILMSGVSSFKIEWTDGKVFSPTNPLTGQSEPRVGQLKWYGPTLPSGGVAMAQSQWGNDNSATDNTVEGMGTFNGSSFGTIQHNIAGSQTSLNDHYFAVFNHTNRDKWPKALRFTMHVASERLSGGRDFVQVVNLPQ